MTTTFIACPNCGSIAPETAISLSFAAATQEVILAPRFASLLTTNFNQLWAECLNRRASAGISRYAMIHSDISAEPQWLRKLKRELLDKGADILSVVIPIKSDAGLTSTAVYRHSTGTIRRLTTADLESLPPTFSAARWADDCTLLVNSGLWICRFDRPWVEDVLAEPPFRQIDWIEKHPDGTYEARSLSEDWLFSFWCKRRGLKVLATKIIQAEHYGRRTYRNTEKWGWDTDQTIQIVPEEYRPL